MKKIGLVITDGVGYRNFILSDFIKESLLKYDQVVIFSCIPRSVFPILNKNVKIIELDIFKESFYTWFFKKWKEVTHLRIFESTNFGISDTIQINSPKGYTFRAIASRFIYLFSKIFASEKLINLYNKFQQKTFSKNPIIEKYLEIFEKNKTDVLFFTHQRPSFIAPIIYVAEILKIKTATFIFSWDNIASKGRMAGNFDNYFVWNELMKNELLKFYTSIKEEKIFVVGTPQFEMYAMDSIGYSKEELVKKFKLNLDNKIILFTCNDSSSKNDPIYLEELAKAIKSNKITSKVNLIVRTSPAENPDRFKYLMKEYDFIKWNFPEWVLSREKHHESWTQRIPTLTDVNDLKSLLMHSDLVINVLSTITLDSFVFNKPVINPVFGNKDNEFADDQKFLRYLHLERLVDSKSSTIVKNNNDYIKAVNNILNGNDRKGIEREEFLELQTLLPLKNTSKRFIEALSLIQ